MARPDHPSGSPYPQPTWGGNVPEDKADKAPVTKVAMIPAGGALSIVLLWLAELLKIPMSSEVAVALSTLVMFIVSYLVPERKA